MRFKKIGSKIYGGSCEIEYEDAYGEDRHTKATIRIDGRDGSYRVDYLGSLGRIWEAIDDGRGFASVKQAENYASAWCREATIQRTLSPHGMERHRHTEHARSR